MEIRLNASGTSSLATKVFFCDDEAFAVASVIVTGKTDAVLIDAQWTLSSAHRVIAEVLETGKELTTIYLTHAHPDHYFGVGVIAAAFPKARVVAVPSDAEMMNSQFFGKMEIWETSSAAQRVPHECAGRAAEEDHIELEGERLEIIRDVIGDMRFNTMVWMPSIKTLYASDVLFNQAHPFTCEVTAEERGCGSRHRQDRDHGRRGDHPGSSEAGHAVRSEFARFHRATTWRPPRRSWSGGHSRRLLLRHGRALPRRPSFST